MMNLTHIHNLEPYAVASIITLTLSSLFVANIIYDRWFKKSKYTLMGINAIIKGVIVLFGFSIINWALLFQNGILIQLISLIAGVILGYILIRFEKFMLRKFFRKNLNQSIYNKTLVNKKNSLQKKSEHYSYFSTTTVGVFEEILYRGFLTILCLNLNNYPLSIACLLLVTTAFAINHFSFGYLHVFTKFILGLICLISFLLIGSVLVSIAIHATFNFLAVKKYRELQYD